MTTEELRELDAQVAVKVIGYKETVYYGARVFERPGFQQGKELPATMDGSDVWPSLPYFTRNLAAAFEVVGRVDAFWFNLRRECGKWYAEFGVGQTVNASAETPELAICLAALKATDPAPDEVKS